MKFWDELKNRLHKIANLDEHAANIARHAAGSQIMVPKVLNDGSQVSDDYHAKVKGAIESAGMKHASSPATGGWMSDDHGLMIEPMIAHRGYAPNINIHKNVRENILPDINKSLNQEASLGTFSGYIHSDGEPIAPDSIPRFTMQALHARMPINLDPADKNNSAYRDLLGQIAKSHGGFTHYQTPKGNQLEVLGHSPEELSMTQNSISDYLKRHHGVEGDFKMPSVNGYLHFADGTSAGNPPKTAALKHKTADVRNALHELSKGSQRGDAGCIQYLQSQGIDFSPTKDV